MSSTSVRSRRLVGLVAAGAVALAACGSDDATTEPAEDGASTSSTSPSTVPPDTAPAAGGWIGGEPDWYGGEGAGSVVEESAAEVAVDMPMSEPALDGGAARDDADASEEFEAPIEPGDDIIAPPPSDEPLRAGSVDDGVDFAGFLQYVERVAEAGFAARDADLRGRVVVSVVDDAGNPVPGVAVVATAVGADGAPLDATPITARTTADGTARLFPALHGLDAGQTLSVGLADGSVEPAVVEAGRDVTLTAAPVSLGDPVPLDVLFLFDATGSMGDEIDRLKRTIDTVADRVSQLDPRPDVRFAMTLYRDEGDAFVTSSFDFASDVGVFREALAGVVADGGGDYPEALDEGLAEALRAPAWRDPSTAVQLVFLVADAPPQVDRQVEVPYTDSIRSAIDRGIKIFPIASSDSDDVAELVFRQLAVTTGAPFVFLSYGAGGAATGGTTDIDQTDYEELSLDELVVRLIAEELADLTGGDEPPIPPTTAAPVTTNPEGQ